MPSAFLRLKELQLNKTRMTWPEVEQIIALMPKLELVELGYNELRQLTSEGSSDTAGASTIQVLNFDGNELDDWSHVARALGRYDAYV
jgi:hypothetical protein